MVDQLRRLKSLSGSEQASHYHKRERRRTRVDPALGLFQTHSFVAADSGFDVGDAFPDRTRPITIAVDIRRSGSSSNGIVFELGNAATGLAIWVTGSAVYACAGNSAADAGVTLNVSNGIANTGSLMRIVFAVVPGTGAARLWVNGKLRAARTSANGALVDGFSADASGGIGAVSTAVIARVPAAQRVTLANVAIVGPVRVFAGQTPRSFNDQIEESAVFAPTDVAGLSIWWDPSEPTARTLDTGVSPPLVTALANIVSPGDGDGTGTLSGASPPQYAAAALNGNDAMFFDAASNRALVMQTTASTTNKVGTGPWRVFTVVRFSSVTTGQECIFANCGSDAGGGSFNLQHNNTGTDILRAAAADAADGTQQVGAITQAASPINDGNIHVVMMGRKDGTGTAGVDQLTLWIDGVEVGTVDLDATFGSMSNTGATNLVTAWLMIGAVGLAPNQGQRYLDDCYVGPFLLYKADVSSEDEASIYEYLAERWVP